jgi:prepilin-type N-terminal cleavage/methylation domain-containing protein
MECTRFERGFTLLEVLVALVILMLGVGAFYQAFGIGLRII